MNEKLRFLLFQVRNPDDPMRDHEVRTFAGVLDVRVDQIQVFDLLSPESVKSKLEQTDMCLLGGSGHYSAAADAPWLDRALDRLRDIHDSRKPTFASCWGFQAMARAMGGRVIKDTENAEVGTHDIFLTEAGKQDPLFAPLGESFPAAAGHEDRVVELPVGVTLLASTDKVENQAYRFDDRPIYCTQFHPELTRQDLRLRVESYPEYVEKIAGISMEEFVASLRETPETAALLRRFATMVFE